MKHQLTVVWQHIRRSPYQAAAAIMIMTLTMFVSLFFLLLSLASQQLLTSFEQKPQVIVFFKDDITSEDQIMDLEKQINDTGKVARLNFVSKEKALEIYKDRNKDDPLLLELVTANTLPSSLEVSAKNVSDLPVLYEILQKAPKMEEISYQKDIVNTLIAVLDKLRKFGVFVISFLVATSLFTILTIIGMKIALRREEIEVERLVGASTWYIRWPFLLEGMCYGIIGALISWAVIFLSVYLLTPYLSPAFSGLSLFPVPIEFSLLVLLGSIFSGAFVGGSGSFFAVWRYLKD